LETQDDHPIANGENLRNHYGSSKYLRGLERFPGKLKIVRSNTISSQITEKMVPLEPKLVRDLK
jgi:hypothetical protein